VRFRLVDWLIVAAVVALAAVPLVFVGSDSEFGGADGVAAEVIEAEPGFAPWAAPLFEPESETASGLFALQAALGAGVLGYVFGVYRTRRRLAGGGRPEGQQDGPADAVCPPGHRAGVPGEPRRGSEGTG
jgi:cobalt/nickel transport protein